MSDKDELIKSLLEALQRFGNHDDYCNIGRTGCVCNCGFKETMTCLEDECDEGGW